MHKHGVSEVAADKRGNAEVDNVQNEAVEGAEDSTRIGRGRGVAQGVNEVPKGQDEDGPNDAMTESSNGSQQKHQALFPAGEAVQGEEAHPVDLLLGLLLLGISPVLRVFR